MWWKKTPFPERPLREQLIAARDDVRRQIAVLAAGPSSIGTAVGDFADNSEVLGELKDALDQIEAELPKSGPA